MNHIVNVYVWAKRAAEGGAKQAHNYAKKDAAKQLEQEFLAKGKAYNTPQQVAELRAEQWHQRWQRDAKEWPATCRELGQLRLEAAEEAK